MLKVVEIDPSKKIFGELGSVANHLAGVDKMVKFMQ